MDAAKYYPDHDQEEEIADPPEYAAFKVGGGEAGRTVTALEIRTRKPRWPAPAYRWLLYTLEDGEQGTFLALIFSCAQIYVRGRNLRPVAAAIKRHRCAVLWEYHPERWPFPQDKSAPFIASIVVHLPKPAEEEIELEYMASVSDETAGA